MTGSRGAVRRLDKNEIARGHADPKKGFHWAAPVLAGLGLFSVAALMYILTSSSKARLNSAKYPPVPDSAVLLQMLGRWRYHQKDWRGSLLAYEQARSLCVLKGTLATPRGMKLLNMIITLKSILEDDDLLSDVSAMFDIINRTEAGQQMDEMLLSLDSPVTILQNFASRMQIAKHHESEIAALRFAVRFQELDGSLMRSLDGATTLTRLGLAYSHDTGSLRRSYETYLMAKRVFDEGNVTSSRVKPVLLNNIALCLGLMGDDEGELMYIREAVKTIESTEENQTEAFGHMLYLLSKAQESAGDVQKARVSWIRANEIFETMRSVDLGERYRASVIHQIGLVRMRRGHLAAALEAFELSDRIYTAERANDDDVRALQRDYAFVRAKAYNLSAGGQSRLSAQIRRAPRYRHLLATPSYLQTTFRW